MNTTDLLLFAAFAATLFGVARFHHHALRIAVAGLGVVFVLRFALTQFDVVHHFAEEWRTLVNLGGLLFGFALLANHFERSRLAEALTEFLPSGRAGAFSLLAIVAVLSAVLDNIAAALIGGSAALALFRRKVHVGYVAAIVAASNAGGAGSVIGDTTTTMMWIDGAHAVWIATAALGAAVAVSFSGFFASRQQHALQPLERSGQAPPPVDFLHVAVVVLVIGGAIATNLLLDFPAVGVWGAILLGALARQPDWRVLATAAPGVCFLLSLVLAASMMPVESLPPPSALTAFGLGIVSAFFDNIPLTKLAIAQDGYDWGLLAFCVGYGGSMLWFGSSAGVAISGLFHEARSARAWLAHGWHVVVAFVLGFAVMFAMFGWNARALDRPERGTAPVAHPR